jgi:hypothetical protein
VPTTGKLPKDEGLEDTQRLLEQLDATLKRVRGILDGPPMLKIPGKREEEKK